MKYGSAHVGGLYTVPGGSGTQFADGSREIFETIGLDTLKVYCASSYLTDYPLQTAWSSTPANMTQLAQTTQFTTELARAWDTVVFTIFTFANGTTNWWRTDPSNARFLAEETEVYNLAVHLLTTYNNSGKTFILQNWEGDWAFMDSTTVTTEVERKMVDFYAAFFAARQRGVHRAMRDTAHVNVSVKHAIEVNRVVDAMLYPHRRRIVNDIARIIQPDLVSLSAYDGTIVDQGGWGADTAAWVAATTPVFTKELRRIKAAFPGVPLYIGEFGFPENEALNDHPNNDVGVMIQTTRDICLAEDVTHLIYWEIFDNSPSVPYTYRGFWLEDTAGTPTIAGAKFQGF